MSGLLFMNCAFGLFILPYKGLLFETLLFIWLVQYGRSGIVYELELPVHHNDLELTILNKL